MAQVEKQALPQHPSKQCTQHSVCQLPPEEQIEERHLFLWGLGGGRGQITNKRLGFPFFIYFYFYFYIFLFVAFYGDLPP